MYQIIYNILSHSYTQGDQLQSYVLNICSALIVILVITFIDLVYRIFSNFWR